MIARVVEALQEYIPMFTSTEAGISGFIMPSSMSDGYQNYMSLIPINIDLVCQLFYTDWDSCSLMQ